MPKNNSPDIINFLILAVLENNFAGVRVAILIFLSLKYMNPYQIEPISKYATKPIFSPIENRLGLIPPAIIAE